MAGDDSTGNTPDWPLPKFYFQVEWASEVLTFQEISGLHVEGDIVEYRHGNSPHISTINTPGLRATSRVTLKNGVFRSETRFRDWLEPHAIKRPPMTISLLDGAASPTMVWTLAHAWPARITVVDVTPDGTEVAVEVMEVGHEGITIENG